MFNSLPLATRYSYYFFFFQVILENQTQKRFKIMEFI